MSPSRARGQPSAGSTRGPDALVGAAGADGAYEIANVPARSYPSVLFRAPGYDRQIAPVTVAANATAARDVSLWRNWASAAGGSSVLGDSPFGALGCGPEAAVDQRATTGWSTRASDAGVLVITLPRAVDVDRFAIDPTEACGSASSAATKNFLVETSTSSAGGPWTAGLTATLSTSARHRMNEFAPTAGAEGVRFVRVSLRDNFGGAFRDMTEFAVYGAPDRCAAGTDTRPACAAGRDSGGARASGRPAARASDVLAAQLRQAVRALQGHLRGGLPRHREARRFGRCRQAARARPLAGLQAR